MIKTMALKENQMCVVYAVIRHLLGAQLHLTLSSVSYGTAGHPTR